MKAAGIVCLVIAGILLVAAIFTATENSQYLARAFNSVCTWTIIGVLLVYFGNKRKKDKENRDKWENS